MTDSKEERKFDKATLDQYEILKRGADEILPEKSFLEKLEKSIKTGKPLKIKAGFDPTAPDLHLGHTVLLRKLRQFQDLGHEVTFLIGDFTATIGDPTGRSATRKRLTPDEVKANAKTYEDQVFKILDREKTKIVFNSKWCMPLKVDEVLGLTARYTVARMIERDDFSKRMKAGESISIIEFIYPLFQGYDSVVLESDVELGGTDQKFNLLVGRELQSQYGQEPQCILTLPLLVGLDGQKKMSKSYDNYIGIDETPYSIFAKSMSVSDELMWDYYTLLTSVPFDEMDDLKKDPLEAKKRLASELVDFLHPEAGSDGKSRGQEARDAWDKEKGKDGREKLILPPDTPVLSVDAKELMLTQAIVDAGLEKSASAVKRLIDSGAIRMGESLEVIQDKQFTMTFPGRYEIKIGKKKYLVVESRS
ncbi:MAG: tyrosine--tRNA ligase [Leptospiraceae bacterium]|nr:tyrosine--tRNA ligase [Leptospiraceae bacterium]MCB1302632.1 tyrosine--tRNA ligase [Leptospiraceae bacterium]